MTGLEFRNKLVERLNNTNRYVGGTYNGRFYPEVETFDIDEVYEIIDEIFRGSRIVHNCSNCGHGSNCDLYRECEFSVNSDPSKWIPNN